MSLLTLGLGKQQVRPIKYFAGTITLSVEINAAVVRAFVLSTTVVSTFALDATIDRRASYP